MRGTIWIITLKASSSQFLVLGRDGRRLGHVLIRAGRLDEEPDSTKLSIDESKTVPMRPPRVPTSAELRNRSLD